MRSEVQPKQIKNSWVERSRITKRIRCRKILAAKRLNGQEINKLTLALILFARSCISKASKVANTLKMRIPKHTKMRIPKYDDAFEDQPDLSQGLRLNPDQPMTAPPAQTTTSAPIIDTSESDSFSIRGKRQKKKQKKSTSQQTQAIVENVQSNHGYSSAIPITDTAFIGTASPRNPNERWSIDLHPNIPMEREMTIHEAEQCKKRILIKTSLIFDKLYVFFEIIFQ